jgi:hypothetical protein
VNHDILKEQLEKFANAQEPKVHAPSSPKASGVNKKKSSPDLHEKPVQLKRQRGGEEDVVDGGDDLAMASDSDLPREVCYSPVYKGKNIMSLLMIAIRCGAKAAAARTSRALPSDGGKAGGGGECGMVHSTGLQWKKLSTSTVWNYNKTPVGTISFSAKSWVEVPRGVYSSSVAKREERAS